MNLVREKSVKSQGILFLHEGGHPVSHNVALMLLAKNCLNGSILHYFCFTNLS